MGAWGEDDIVGEGNAPNLFIQEDEMASRLQHPPLPSTTRAETFARLTGAGPPRIPVLRETTQVGSQVIGGVSPTFVVPGKEKAVATEPTETGIAADERKRKEREETIQDIEGSKEAHTKRSRAAEMHNISERRRREKINEKMKALQELIPRCSKTDKASMLDDAIEYVKSLQLQIQMMSVGSGMMPVMYPPNMQQFMPHMAMGTNRPPFIPCPGTPFPRQPHTVPSYPAPRYPFPNIQASDHPQCPGYMNPYIQFAGLQPHPLAESNITGEF